MNVNHDLAGGKPLNTLQIGCGAFGTHLAAHLNQKSWQNVVTTKRSLEGLELEGFDYIFLATNDSSLKRLAKEIQKKAPFSKIVHFSGFHYIENTLGMHPVASFNKTGEYNLDAIDFVADGEVDEPLKTIFQKLSKIAPSKKRDYHNFISVTANALQLVVHDIGCDFEKATDLDSSLLKKIVLQSLESEKKIGAQSFSGPWVRGEKEEQNRTVSLMNSKSLQNLNKLFNNEIEIFKAKNN